MLKSLSTLLAVLAATLLLPLLGALLGGVPLSDLLALPLQRRAWDPLPASGTWTLIASALALLIPALIFWLAHPVRPAAPSVDARGRAGQSLHTWPRYTWLSALLPIAAIAAVDGDAINLACGLLTLAVTIAANADTERRTGHSLLRQRPGYFYTLFLVSLAAGWALYWLNLYLQLWTYPAAAETVPFVLGKSIDYAVLLPALLSLRQWLASFPPLLGWTNRARPLGSPLSAAGSPPEGALLAGTGAIGLAGAALWPDWIYPLTLLAPLLVVLGVQQLSARPTLLAGLPHGDWSRVLLPMAAALLLGLVTQGCNTLLGPAWVLELPLLGGPSPLGLPLPAWTLLALLGPLGVWLGDQLTTPWKQRPQQPPHRPRFPIKIVVESGPGRRRN